MLKKDLIIIGGGGHGKSCIEVVESTGLYNIVGILDVPERVGEKVLSYPIIGSDEDVEKYKAKGCSFLNAIGQLGSCLIRKQVFDKLRLIDAHLPTIISPFSYVSRNSTVGAGTVIMHQAFVNTNVSIGENCIINTKAILEHDVVLGNDNHISTGAILNGNCNLGVGIFIGSNATILQGITVGNFSVIGAGSVVIGNVAENSKIAGVPAKNINR